MRGSRALTRSRRDVSVAAVGSLALIAIAFNGGGYSIGARTGAVIVVWWAIALGLGVIGDLGRPTRATAGCIALFTAFTAWTGLSSRWSHNAEASFEEFDRALLYLGVLGLVALVARRRFQASVLDGASVVIALVGVAALSTRLFPGLVSDNSTLTFLPGSLKRLAYPLNYWNGLAVFLAIGVPPLLRAAAVWKLLAARGLAVAALPPIVAALYLTSSRGGFAALACGLAIFVGCTDRRWIVIAGALAGGIGGGVAIMLLKAHPRLVDGPFDGPLVASQGHTTAGLIALVSVAVGAVFAVAIRIGSRVPRPSPLFERGLLVCSAAVVVLAIALAHPIRRFDTFKQPPPISGGSQLLQDHLLSGGGTGRWQLWSVAAHEADGHLLMGRGAGTFGEWWAAHGTLPLVVRDAHSLYLETLGELGVVGLVLLLGSFAAGAVGGVVQLRSGANRPTVAAALGGFAAYCIGAGLDWMWELTAVSVVGVAFLGVLVAAGERPAAKQPARRPIRGAVIVLSLAVAACCVLPWLVQARLDASASAATRGDVRTAYRDALGAGRLEPWAASPEVQAALVAEQAGDLPLAQRRIARAIERDRENWRLWYIRARILRAAGRPNAARRDLEQALALNPHSAVLAAAVSGR